MPSIRSTPSRPNVPSLLDLRRSQRAALERKFQLKNVIGQITAQGAAQPVVPPTPSITPTNTPTPSITPTNTPTPSITPSVTPTITVTSSVTPSVTLTPSITPTSTVTPTITPTASITPTITPTNTLTPTQTPTTSVTPSITPTNTLTPTQTPSITPTKTPNPTPSVTPTQTPTPSITPTVTPSITPTVTPTKTPNASPTPTVTPTTPSVYQGRGKYYVNYNGSGDDVYVSVGYPISAILDKSPGFNVTETNNILSAFDFWGDALNGSTFNVRTETSTIYTGTEFVSNPLNGVGNNSLVVFLTASNAGNNGTLGEAGIQVVRRGSEQYTSQYAIPYRAYFYLNSYYNASYLSLTTANNKNGFYYTVLHELAHTLGVGTGWYSKTSSGSNLYSCYIVGAGDTTTNPLGLGLSANFFYTLSTLNNSRPVTAIGNPTTIGTGIDMETFYIGDASYQAAYNLLNTAVSSSHAVSAYNAAFNLNLSAIPVENGLGFGSIGSHWDEGYNGGTVGNDDRTYYGNATPGAPCLNDELMTPISEGGYDMPCSKITLGALKDMGYTVNFNKSDIFSPLIYNVYSNGMGNVFDIGFYGNTYRVAGKSTSNSGRVIILKRGLTYSFVRGNFSTDHPLYIVTVEGQTGSPPASRVTDGVTNDGAASGTLTWAVPTSLTAPSTYYLQCGLHASMVARLLVY